MGLQKEKKNALQKQKKMKQTKELKNGTLQ